jgi:hypothetical protein
MVAALTAFAAPAMANDKNERNDQNRTTIFDDGNRNNIFHDGNRNDIFDDGNRNNIFHDGNDIFDDGSAFFFVNPWLFVEEIDIDCDGVDDDWDGGIDEGADCEVEIEFFEW